MFVSSLTSFLFYFCSFQLSLCHMLFCLESLSLSLTPVGAYACMRTAVVWRLLLWKTKLTKPSSNSNRGCEFNLLEFARERHEITSPWDMFLTLEDLTKVSSHLLTDVKNSSWLLLLHFIFFLTYEEDEHRQVACVVLKIVMNELEWQACTRNKTIITSHIWSWPFCTNSSDSLPPSNSLFPSSYLLQVIETAVYVVTNLLISI